MFCALGLTGCVKPALTEEVIQSYDLDEDRMRDLQLYTSDTIVLHQEVTKLKCENGRGVQLTQDVEIRRVVIKKGTPGRALRFEGDHILVGFVPNEEQYSIWFSRKHDRADVAIEHEEFRLSHIDNPYDPNAPPPEATSESDNGCQETKPEGTAQAKPASEQAEAAEPKAAGSSGKFVPHYPNSRVVRYNNGNYRPEEPTMWNVFLVYDGEALKEHDIVDKPPGWLVTGESKKDTSTSAKKKKLSAEASTSPAN